MTRRARGVAVITALVAQDVTDERPATHIRPAGQNGLDGNALTTPLILPAGYLGCPRASLAMETVNNLDLPPNTAVSRPPLRWIWVRASATARWGRVRSPVLAAVER